MKVSKEFILKAHKAANKEWALEIEEQFPSIFQREVGKWYIGGSYLFFLKELKDKKSFKYSGYGFCDGKWQNEMNFNVGGICFKSLATKEEVTQALTAEAKKRGYKDGNYKCLYMPSESDKHIDKYLYYLNSNELWTNRYGSSNNKVFDNGKWAEIIPQATKITVAEIEKQLGYKIEIVK